MKIKPLFDRVLLEKISNRTTSSGIHIPQTNDKCQLMKVVSIGDGCNLELEPGANVYVHKYSGVAVGENFIVNQHDILGEII